MDIAVCSLDRKSNILQFAGANNPLWLVRKNGGQPELTEYKGDKYPIGIFLGDKVHTFQNYTIHLQEGDMVYIFSDGYADQFGGENLKSGGKKFKYSRLRELLISMSQKPLTEQKKILIDTFYSWKGNLEQVDDVCIIGVRV
jgi:serine phosphatase RsbU (regulator of sigma subunit)